MLHVSLIHEYAKSSITLYFSRTEPSLRKWNCSMQKRGDTIKSSTEHASAAATCSRDGKGPSKAPDLKSAAVFSAPAERTVALACDHEERARRTARRCRRADGPARSCSTRTAAGRHTGAHAEPCPGRMSPVTGRPSASWSRIARSRAPASLASRRRNGTCREPLTSATEGGREAFHLARSRPAGMFRMLHIISPGTDRNFPDGLQTCFWPSGILLMTH